MLYSWSLQSVRRLIEIETKNKGVRQPAINNRVTVSSGRQFASGGGGLMSGGGWVEGASAKGGPGTDDTCPRNHDPHDRRHGAHCPSERAGPINK